MMEIARFSRLKTAIDIAILGSVLVFPFSANASADKKQLLQNAKFISTIKRLNQVYQAPVNTVESQTYSSASSRLNESNETDFSNSQSNLNVLPVPLERFSEGEELILNFSIENIALNEVFAIKTADSFLVSFNSFVQMVDFPISVNMEQSRANGWYITEQSRFNASWNDTNLSVTAAGKEYSTDKFSVVQDELYVDITLLAEWFTFGFKVDETDLKLVITPTIKYPLQAKLERESTKIYKSDGTKASVLPLRDAGYKMFTIPTLDAQISSSSSKSSDAFTSYSLVGGHDLSYLSSKFYLYGDQDKLVRTPRLTLSKESEGEETGPLGFSYIELGDVTPVNVSSIDSTKGQGRGLVLNSRKLNELQNNRKVNLVGQIQDGWDAELYRNGVLLDRRLSSTGGRYEFNDIDLQFGRNDFEIVFYGPQGQIERTTESYNIVGNILEQGESSYSFSMVNLNTGLFDDLTGVNTNEFAETGWLASGIYDIGLTDFLTISAGSNLLRSAEAEDEKDYVLKTDVSLGVAIAGASYERNDKGDDRQNLSLRSQILGQAVTLSRSQTHYNDEPNDSTSDSVTISGPLITAEFLPVNHQTEFSTVKSATNQKFDVFKNSLAFRTDLFSVFNTIESTYAQKSNSDLSDDFLGNADFLNEQPLVLSEDRNTFGGLRLARSFGSVLAQFGIDYELSPYKTSRYSALANFPLGETGRSQLTVSFSPETKVTRTSAALTWRNDNIQLTSNMAYDSNDNWTLGIFAQMSFGYSPTLQSFHSSSSSMTDSGSMAVRVFEDKNNNQKFDANEKIIEGAKVDAVQAYRNAQTNSKGVALINNLSPGYITDIVLDRDSLNDPYMIGSIEGVAIKPRKGVIETLDYPVVSAGEVEGTIYIKDDAGNSQPASFIEIKLIDKTGIEVQSVRSEFDGYYVFANVKPGVYKIKLGKLGSARPSDDTETAKFLAMKGGGEIVNGMDFVLSPKESRFGYALHLGDFRSLNVLKAYWGIVRKGPMNEYLIRPFYHVSDLSNDVGSYELYGSFVATEQRAQALCNGMKKYGIKCEVREHEFKI